MNYSELYQNIGYEVYFNEEKILFVQRNTYALSIFLWIALGIAFIIGINVLIQIFVHPTIGAVISIPFFIFLSFFGILFKIIKVRNSIPPEQAPNRYSWDLKDGMVKDANEQTIEQLGNISLKANYNYFNRTQDLKMIFPSGERHKIYSGYCALSFRNQDVESMVARLSSILESQHKNCNSL